MRATAFEFRMRMAIMFILVAIGFWAPWVGPLGLGGRTPLLEWLALDLSRAGLLSFTGAIAAVIVLASVIALVAAVFRVWGAAWLGQGTVNSFEMRASAVVAGGPYRYVRNPLYIGTWCVIAAIAFVMPVSGALFCMVLLSVFLLRLILAEEAFLTAQIGEPYLAYRRAVPRLFPRLRTSLPLSAETPRWGRAILAEINPIGVFVITAVLSWRYDKALMLRAILISFGVSLVVRALMPGGREQGKSGRPI
jgi:protein-S-isoprenylcysteine O-methyltransferase Ste14